MIRALNRYIFAAVTTRLECRRIVKKKRFSPCSIMQEKIPVRIVIYAKDVINITGRKERAAWKLLAQIRRHYNKQKGQFITVKEFSAFTGIEEESIYSYLQIVE